MGELAALTVPSCGASPAATGELRSLSMSPAEESSDRRRTSGTADDNMVEEPRGAGNVQNGTSVSARASGGGLSASVPVPLRLEEQKNDDTCQELGDGLSTKLNPRTPPKYANTDWGSSSL